MFFSNSPSKIWTAWASGRWDSHRHGPHIHFLKLKVCNFKNQKRLKTHELAKNTPKSIDRCSLDYFSLLFFTKKWVHVPFRRFVSAVSDDTHSQGIFERLKYKIFVYSKTSITWFWKELLSAVPWCHQRDAQSDSRPHPAHTGSLTSRNWYKTTKKISQISNLYLIFWWGQAQMFVFGVFWLALLVLLTVFFNEKSTKLQNVKILKSNSWKNTACWPSHLEADHFRKGASPFMAKNANTRFGAAGERLSPRRTRQRTSGWEAVHRTQPIYSFVDWPPWPVRAVLLQFVQFTTKGSHFSTKFCRGLFPTWKFVVLLFLATPFVQKLRNRVFDFLESKWSASKCRVSGKRYGTSFSNCVPDSTKNRVAFSI